MVEPMKLILDENDSVITIGKCCVCGEIWDLKEYPITEAKRVQRYLDGMPLNFSEKDMKYICYCKHCNNVTIYEYPFSDKNGVRDRCHDEQYKQILASDEPIEVKRIKLAEYKFKDTKDDIMTLQRLNLYWYYDTIGDKKQMYEYAEKLIKLHERKIYYSIKVNTRCLLQIPGERLFIDLDMVLIDIYRRQSNFDKAIELINDKRESLYIKDDDIIEMKWLALEQELCNKKDTGRY